MASCDKISWESMAMFRLDNVDILLDMPGNNDERMKDDSPVSFLCL
eukprot:CAMPEP_0197828454 /NCGR_PEP_ID=MMETSP1437-20131217/5015_1 /TAXON_ID=49252 ORGANISM="Eucampia antarctica, Strain CCMP1452" /NCGR_SAMPLE_ID=MMETSP1437 /ASSEMBLY_ACC=CAM_ASM_001096 /LENGTH=45 /DNA_ID= /DNA_START= /DNA_END= /DNA_ORIENTATION=